MSKPLNDTPDFHRGCHCLSVVSLSGFLVVRIFWVKGVDIPSAAKLNDTT